MTATPAMTGIEHLRAARLDVLEAVIEANLIGFFNVGQALTEIRDSKLYRITHADFDAYVDERWKMSRRRAYQLIGARSVVDDIRNAALPMPTSERVCRELVRLSAAERVSVWTNLTRQDSEPTERDVRLWLRESKRQKKLTAIAAKAAGELCDVAGGPFSVVYADPPWQYDSGTTDPTRVIENQYETMPVEEISQLWSKGLGDIVTDDAILFLWATNPLLPEALHVMAEWDFTYKANRVWVKDRIGPGYWVRNRHELLLIGVRGDIPTPNPSDLVDSILEAPRAGHSEKPDQVREMIESYYPELAKVELFARVPVDGWAAWGNQL